MAKNVRQHIESQLIIRNFLGGKEKLFCLDKRTLTVKDRQVGNIPSAILAKDHYYSAPEDDFDAEVVQPIENRFGPLCMRLLSDHEKTMGESGTLEMLIEWTSLAVVRTRFFAQAVRQAVNLPLADRPSEFSQEIKRVELRARRDLFERIKYQMSSVGLVFRFIEAPSSFTYLLTDHPPLAIPFDTVRSMGPILLPLSHRLMLAQVPHGVAERFFGWLGAPSVGLLALLQLGWADRLVYSADLGTLDFAAELLRSGECIVNAEMASRARQPFFGFNKPGELESMWQTQGF